MIDLPVEESVKLGKQLNYHKPPGFAIPNPAKEEPPKP